MSNKKNARRPRGQAENAANQEAGQFGAPVTAAAGWPDDFPARRTVKLALAGLAGVAAGAFLIWLLKVYFPGNHLMASVDARTIAVITGMIITAAAGLLHPSFGLAVVVLLRHWMDGITYPGDNAYFNCALLYLFVLWGARTLLRGNRVQFGAPVVLLAAFLGINVITAFSGYEIATSYRAVLGWCGAFALFVLATNGLRSGLSISIVLGSLLAGELCHAVYAIIQYEYVFDYTRQWLMENPARLRSFFGPEPPTPELLRRLNLNRAFGTMLFPNALAAFLILTIPLCVCGAISSILRHNEAAQAAQGRTPRGASFRFGVVVMLVSLLACFFATALFTIMAYMDADAFLIFGVSFGISVVLGLLHGFVAERYAASRGIKPARYGMTAYFLLLLLVVQSVALWRTYSRGAMLALFAASMFGLLLLWRGHGMYTRHAVHAARGAAAALMLTGVAVALLGGLAAAQAGDTPAAAANTAEISAPGAPEELPIEARKLLEGGADITVRELLDPSSFSMRLKYWKVGLRMAWDNLLAGVGPGNFGVAYPKYQTVDAGDVDTAHNDYLQALCETGVFGLLAFLGFWGWFVIWGAWRIMKEDQSAERYLLAGLYLGPLAFLLHCMVDFNFYNPSLVFYVMLVSALFYGRAALTRLPLKARPAGSAVGHQVAVLFLLVAAALAVGMNLRVYFQDYALSGKRMNVADQERLGRRYDVGRAFLQETSAFGVASKRAQLEGGKPEVSPAHVTVRDALTFLGAELGRLGEHFTARQQLEQLGVLAVPTRGGGWRKLDPSEPMHEGAWLWLTKRPWRTVDLAHAAAEAWLAEIESIDAMFPHRPDLAAYIADWYEMLLGATYRPNRESKHAEYLAKYLEWARTGMERCPERAEFHGRYGLALWIRADFAEGDARNDYCERAIEQYRIAQRLRPDSSARFSWELHGVLKKYGEALVKQGKAEKGQKYIEESVIYARHAEYVQSERGRLGLP